MSETWTVLAWDRATGEFIGSVGPVHESRDDAADYAFELLRSGSDRVYSVHGATVDTALITSWKMEA